MLRASILLLTVAALACGDGAPPPADTGDAEADAAMDAPPITPTIDNAALPVLTPCPPGWREVSGGAGAPDFCEPFAGDGPDDCAAEEAHFPGTPGCAALGDPCPIDGFPSELPASGVVFVRADAAPGGDGSRASPFAGLVEAVAAAADGGTIVVAPGTYEGRIVIDRPVSIIGACTAVVLTSTDRLPTVEISDTDVTMRDLRVSSSVGGVAIRNATLELSNFVIDAVATDAISALNSEITASRLVIRDIGDSGIALAASSTLSLDQASITDVRNDSLRTSRSQAVVTDTVFVRSLDGSFYFGTQSGGVTFERVAFLGEGTILGYDAPQVTLRDAVFVGPELDVPIFAGAIATFEGGDLSIERARIERARSLGAAVVDPGGVMTMRDVVVRDVVGATDEADGHGIEVGLAAEATLERVWIERAGGIGLLAASAGTWVETHDITIVDTLPNLSGTFGRALQIQSGALLTGSRIVARGNHEVTFVVATDGTSIELSHVLIEDTRERTCVSCATAGIGVGAYLGGHMTLDRFLIRDNALAGVQLANEGAVDLSNGEVASNPVGVNVQVPEYDVGRLTDGVVFRDNDTNLDSSDLPVPDPTVSR